MGKIYQMIEHVEAILFDMGGTLRSTQKRSREERLCVHRRDPEATGFQR